MLEDFIHEQQLDDDAISLPEICWLRSIARRSITVDGEPAWLER